MAHVSFIEPQSKDRMKSVLFGTAVLVMGVISGFFVLENYGLIPYLIVLVIIISALVLWHSRTRVYLCSNCGHKFEVSFWRDLPSIHSLFFMKKMLACPACKFKDYAAELVKVKSD